jgi:hypothetical protein
VNTTEARQCRLTGLCSLCSSFYISSSKNRERQPARHCTPARSPDLQEVNTGEHALVANPSVALGVFVVNTVAGTQTTGDFSILQTVGHIGVGT